MAQYTLKELRELVKKEKIKEKDITLGLVLDISGKRASSSRGMVQLSPQQIRLIQSEILGLAAEQITGVLTEDMLKTNISVRDISSSGGLSRFMGVVPYYTAVGGYFEAKVYENIYDYIKARPDAFNLTESTLTKDGRVVNVRNEAFVSQSDYRFSLFPNVRISIEVAARNAAVEIMADAMKDKKKKLDVVLQAIGGTNPLGDLKLIVDGKEIIFELKYYGDIDNITWYTFSDYDTFNRLFSQVLWDNRPDLWDTPQKKGDKSRDWVQKIQSTGFEKYMGYLAQKEASHQSSNENYNMLKFLLGKGQKFGNTEKAIEILDKKKVIIGSSKLGENRYYVSLTLSEALKVLDGVEITKPTLEDIHNSRQMVYRATIGGKSEPLLGMGFNNPNFPASLSGEASGKEPHWHTPFKMFITSKLLGIPNQAITKIK